jgi:hypothetical protein
MTERAMGRSAPAALFINVSYKLVDADCLASAQMINTEKGGLAGWV